MTTTVLVVDDDPKIVSLVQTYLEREGLRVITASDGRAALTAILTTAPQLVVLDVMLPELDGLALMRTIRESSDVPIVMLSARGSVADRVYGIHEGADDYIAKPFSPAELVVRVKAVLRRTNPALNADEQRVLRQADLTIDLDRLEVWQADRAVALTPAEFRLLTTLVRARGRVVSRQALLDALSGPAQGDALERSVDVHIGRLRHKLGEVTEKPRYVGTVRGFGYRAVSA
jgi:DNA-binding response OmpR family regulator